MPRSIDLKHIHPHGGSQRDAFEELSFLLFLRAYACVGVAVRRNGAGGDGGLEGFMADAEGRALIGLQAKFFDDKLGATQWNDLDESIRRAISDNAFAKVKLRETLTSLPKLLLPEQKAKWEKFKANWPQKWSDLDEPVQRAIAANPFVGKLREIVITVPRTLPPAQEPKWEKLKAGWRQFAAELGCKHSMEFTLWHESHIRNQLLLTDNRGLLLHFFDFPDFDRTHCARKTKAAIQSLADRYLPDLHTATDAEDEVHTFLRSERFRLQYMDKARECLSKKSQQREASTDWNGELQDHHKRVRAAMEKIQSLLGDGITLPTSVSVLAEALDQAAAAHDPLVKGLRALIPPRDKGDDMWRYTTSGRHPSEQAYEDFSGSADALRSLSEFLEEHSAADAQFLLLSGEPGQGKTHVLAEVCSHYAEQGGAVLFLEGRVFQTGSPLWKQIMERADFDGDTVRDFLATFAALSYGTSLPALVCIDALNETTDRNLWRKDLLEFAAELPAHPEIKLIVSCREDYLRQTLPAPLADKTMLGWAFATHQGLGVNVMEALPKYMKAYDVRSSALPPLSVEFERPLFLRIFCEAYSGKTPEAGSLSLPVILHCYAQRKADDIKQRIDCEPRAVAAALMEIGTAMQASGSLTIPYQEAWQICLKHHSVSEASKSLYQALLSEHVLSEVPDGAEDILGNRQLVRFTYERIWDYFLSLRLLPKGTKPDSKNLALLANQQWRFQHAGIVSMLAIRLPEEHHIELCDVVPGGKGLEFDLFEAFMASLPWRTRQSMTERAKALFAWTDTPGSSRQKFDYLVQYAINPAHPWNADWLHEKLMAMPLAKRDRTWTFWVNEKLLSGGRTLDDLRVWAEPGDLSRVPDEQLLLLATVLAWCQSTTVVKQREQLASSLTRVLAGTTAVAARLLERFLTVDDSYVKERVLLACAGAAQHAANGDHGLRDLAQAVYDHIFAGEFVEPHLLIRHYASEICLQAEAKGVLPDHINRDKFLPPWRSKWPRIWSAKKVADRKLKDDYHIKRLYDSVEPGPGYRHGDWGHKVMEYYVHHFQNKKLSEKPCLERYSHFDAQVAKRYVIQRVFELGWDWIKDDTHPNWAGDSGGSPRVESLSQKYQWIALFEMLGHQSDHYHFTNYSEMPMPFQSAKQIDPRGLLDPFVIEPWHEQTEETWHFVRGRSPWWNGHFDPLPRPFSPDEQRWIATRIENDNPLPLIELNDGADKWLTLSAFHSWHEPVPVWFDKHHTPYVKTDWAIQSYLVTPENEMRLIGHLKQRDLGMDTHWIKEPDFGPSMSALKTFPLNMEEMEEKCYLDECHEAREWHTGAISTTCRCEIEEEQKRAKSGSLPSPQLAKMGGLVWTGHKYDFKASGADRVLVQHLGTGFEGACVARKDSLLQWLAASGLRIVWRCYSSKLRSSEHGDECNARDYGMAVAFDQNGKLKIMGGATGRWPYGCHPEEPIPPMS